MKRCPECRRDYYDDTLLYCLDDGNALLDGPASANEPATEILSVPPAVAGGLTAATDETSVKTAILQPPAATGGSDSARGFDKRLLLAPLAFVVIVIGGFVGYRYLNPATSAQINSIAVIPFENRSGSGDAEYLSDGLADSLIYRLSQLPNLKVSPTSSVMRYKGKETDVAQIAKDLEVDAVMSGRLVQRGDDLSISVQLIDSRTGKIIWAEQYDRKMAELLATQREIATTITQKLQLKLSGEEKGITKKYTDSSEAYQLYLKGRYHFAKRTKEDMLKSIEYFHKAIELDPNFALAYSAIAESYNVMPSHGYLSPGEATAPARAAVNKALTIDPSLAEARTQIGSIYSNHDWLWEKAENEYKGALEIDPNNATAHLRYGQHLWAVGRLDESIAELSRAVELEPLSLTASANLILVLLRAQQNQKALELARKTHGLEPTFITGRLALGSAYIGNAMYDDAIRLIENVAQPEAANQWMLWIGGYAHAKSGRRQEAEGFINKFRGIEKNQYVPSYYIATIYAALGDKDKAFAALENSFDSRDWWLARMKSDQFMDPLRDDPRYQNLLRRMNLPE